MLVYVAIKLHSAKFSQFRSNNAMHRIVYKCTKRSTYVVGVLYSHGGHDVADANVLADHHIVGDSMECRRHRYVSVDCVNFQ